MGLIGILLCKRKHVGRGDLLVESATLHAFGQVEGCAPFTLGRHFTLIYFCSLDFFRPLQFPVFKILVVVENERYYDEDFSSQGREESKSFLYSCAQACDYKKATSEKSSLFVGSSVDLNYKGS